MRSRLIMVALPAPGEIGSIEMGKIASLARALDAQVELFHCIYESSVARPGLFASRGAQEDIRGLVQWRRAQLQVLADRLRASGVRARASIRWDHPAYAGVVRQVLRHRPILLVAHPTQRGPAARRVLGRTDFRLMETCPCPVLFIKTRRPYSDAVLLAATDPGRAHGKPAALDAEILGWASRLRDALPARLLLFHAHEPWERALRSEPQLRETPEAVRDEVAAAWRDSMEAGVLMLAQRYAVPDQQVRIAEGPAAEELARFAQQTAADIVVMGAAARSPVRKLLIGHTSERMLDALDTDLLIVKPPGFHSPVSPQSTHHVERSSARPAHTIWL